MKNRISFRRRQSFPRTTESQLNSERRGKQNVNLSSFYFLQVARGYFSPFRQFILRQSLAHPFPAHIGTEGLDSLPFSLGNCHDILHRFSRLEMNDTYIVKTICLLLGEPMQNHPVESERCIKHHEWHKPSCEFRPPIRRALTVHRLSFLAL